MTDVCTLQNALSGLSPAGAKNAAAAIETLIEQCANLLKLSSSLERRRTELERELCSHRDRVRQLGAENKRLRAQLQTGCVVSVELRIGAPVSCSLN